MKYLIVGAAALFFTWPVVMFFPFAWHVAFHLGTIGVIWTMLIALTCLIACYRAVA